MELESQSHHISPSSRSGLRCEARIEDRAATGSDSPRPISDPRFIWVLGELGRILDGFDAGFCGSGRIWVKGFAVGFESDSKLISSSPSDVMAKPRLRISKRQGVIPPRGSEILGGTLAIVCGIGELGEDGFDSDTETLYFYGLFEI
ncbi:hypothetical protein Droror1_Dr00022291 [Drosera rotundifolia]